MNNGSKNVRLEIKGKDGIIDKMLVKKGKGGLIYIY